MTINSKILTLLFFGLISLIVYASFNTDTSKAPTAHIKIPNNIDYYLKNSKQKSYRSDGSLDFSLDSDLLEHFKREDKSLLKKPDALVRRSNVWQITAQEGTFFHPKEIIRFSQNVKLDKRNGKDQFLVSAHTLLFKIKQDLVISESDVKVKSDSWTLNAKTMTLDMQSDIHQFTHVTARYRHDKNT